MCGRGNKTRLQPGFSHKRMTLANYMHIVYIPVCGYGNPLPIKTPDASLLEKATTTRVYSINILNVLPGATSTYFQASKGKTKSKKWARVSKKNYISSIVFAVGLRASTVKQTFMINILKEKGKKTLHQDK